MQWFTRILKQHPLIAFFILAYAMSWLLWIPAVLLLPSESLMVFIMVGGFGPFLAAVIVTSITGGWAGIRLWLRGIFKLRVHWAWYLIGILLPLVVGLLQFGLYRMSGGRSNLTSMTPWYLYPVFLLAIALVGGGNEEPGWRGFGLAGLLKRFPPWLACLILGVLHACWHLPLIGAYIRIPFGWYLIQIIAMAIITSWLYLRSRSILPAMLLHGGANVLTSFISTPLPTQDFLPFAHDYDVTRAIVVWIIALALLLITRGKLGY